MLKCQNVVASMGARRRAGGGGGGVSKNRHSLPLPPPVLEKQDFLSLWGGFFATYGRPFLHVGGGPFLPSGAMVTGQI